MNQRVVFLSIGILFVGAIIFSNGCAKSANPQPPTTDTITLIKNDTTVKTDTLTVPPPPDPTVNLKLGLLLYLPFNGSFADSSGNGNPTSAVNGAALTYDQHGYSNSAFGATGNGEAILVTNNGSIQFDTAYSISLDFMMLTNNSSTRQMFLSMVDYTNGNGPTFNLGVQAPNSANLVFGAFDGAAGCGNSGLNGPNVLDDTTSLVPDVNAWYNLIAIYHKGSAQVYINGKLISSKTGTGTTALLCPAATINVGSWWQNNPISLNGKLDEVRLYDRVLTPHEILTLAQHFMAGSESVGSKLKNGRSMLP
jgi:hypothetical protein